MWAICGSVSLAPCASAAVLALLKSIIAAIAALQRTNMIDLLWRLLSAAHPCCTEVGWSELKEVPGKFSGVAQELQDGLRQAVAAPAGEGERLHHDRTDPALDIVAQK